MAQVPVVGVPATAPVPAVAAEGSTSPGAGTAAEGEDPITAAGAVLTIVSSPLPPAEASGTDEAPAAVAQPN